MTGLRFWDWKRNSLHDIDGFHFVGYVDRMDSLRPGEIRIIDYKTGKVEDKDVNITDDNARRDCGGSVRTR